MVGHPSELDGCSSGLVNGAELRPSLTSLDEWLATQAARWAVTRSWRRAVYGWSAILTIGTNRFSDELRAARRPKLAELAGASAGRPRHLGGSWPQ
jgi:hypothetical protein